MYGIVLTLHSLLRWAVLITGILAASRGITGWRGRRPWTLADERAGFWFTLTLDLQFLLGLLLYAVLSPLTWAAFHDFGGAMRDTVLRFWAVEPLAPPVLPVSPPLSSLHAAATSASTAIIARTSRPFLRFPIRTSLSSGPGRRADGIQWR